MKRLIVLCDGTWLDSAGPRPGNVAHLAHAIRPLARDGVAQIVYYLPAHDDAAAIAHGIDTDIQAVYRFLVHNYQPGDELLLFGFSRGAYIVRSAIGMLRNAWLLRKENAELIPHAYHIYRTLWHADADNALRFREPHARAVNIRFLGVWDTVGALGIPVEQLDGLDAQRYCFHDNILSRIVEHACHALAIDERRKPLTPTLWRTRSDRVRTQQVWFSGSHMDVGGGCREAGLSHISLRWMIEQAAQCGLEADTAYIDRAGEARAPQIVHANSAMALRRTGSEQRVIGRSNADETLHASAEQRYLRDRRYRPKNLLEYLAHDEQIRLPL